MPLMAPALTCVSPAGWLGIKWLSSRGCKDVAGLCPGKKTPCWKMRPTNRGSFRRCRMPVRLVRLAGLIDRGILGVVVVRVKPAPLLSHCCGHAWVCAAAVPAPIGAGWHPVDPGIPPVDHIR